MDTELFLQLGFLIIVTLLIVYTIIQSKNGKLETLLSPLKHEYGLPVPSGLTITAHGLGGEYKDDIVFTYTKNKEDNHLEILVQNIIEIKTFYNYELTKGNLVGRVLIGGVVAGGIGSVIGAITSSEKQKERKFLYMKYSYENEEKELLFSGRDNNDSFVDKFMQGYNNYVETNSLKLNN